MPNLDTVNFGQAAESVISARAGGGQVSCSPNWAVKLYCSFVHASPSKIATGWVKKLLSWPMSLNARHNALAAMGLPAINYCTWAVDWLCSCDVHLSPKMVRFLEIGRAQSMRTAKFYPRYLSQKSSPNCTWVRRECARKCLWKCTRRLIFSVSIAPLGTHEDSHEGAYSKFDSTCKNVHESVLGQVSNVLFSHVLVTVSKHEVVPTNGV